LVVLSLAKLPGVAQTNDDSISIHGKFITPCTVSSVKLRLYKITSTAIDEVPVQHSEFNFKYQISHPNQISIKVENDYFDFMATPDEKSYEIEIACDEKKHFTFATKNSPENEAFEKFSSLSRSMRDTMERFSGKDLADKETFDSLRKIFINYQDKIAALKKNSPNSFTAKVLCFAELLPMEAFNSVETLHKYFFQREALSNASLYNCYLLTRLLINYFFLFGEKDSSFTSLENAMNIARKDPVSSKLLQEVFYDFLFYNHRDRMLTKYIEWAEKHPESMDNKFIKSQLSVLKNCIDGVKSPEIELADTNGVPRRLSETIDTGKLTLLIFYSPNCSHCKEILPKLVPLWNNYKTKGLKIYAVGYDATNEQWKDFIHTRSSTEWTNVFEYPTSIRPSSKFLISYTPTFFLIDHKGIIITRFGDPGFIEKEIPRLLD